MAGNPAGAANGNPAGGAAGAANGADGMGEMASRTGNAGQRGAPAQGQAGAQQRGGMANRQAAGSGASPPPDLPDGSDDDVLARQLREAAQSEPDPELRAKLWREYRRYKGLPEPSGGAASGAAQGKGG